MRPIDAVDLSEGIELHRQATDQEYESDHQWAVGYNAGLDRALYSIACAKTIAPPPNDPLTLEELREMDGEPVWANKIKQWAFVSVFEGTVSLVDRDGLCYTIKMAEPIYRRKPEEGTE